MSNLMEMEVYNAAVKGESIIFRNKNHEQLLKKTCQNNNIIHIAAQHQQLDFIKEALNSFPTTPTRESLICDKNDHGNTPLHIAAEVRDETIIDHFYEFFSAQCGSNRVFPWRMVNSDGNTPAHVALLYGNLSVARYLVEKDDSLARITNHSKETLLHLAIQFHINDDYGSQVPETQEPSTSSETVYKSREDLWPIIELLLKVDSSVTCWADMDGSTPLHQAALLEPAYCIRVIEAMLASYPVAAEIYDKRSGQTILHLLTNHQVASYEQGLKLLQNSQIYALRNSQNNQGDTPLHLAARNRDTIMVRVLKDSSTNLGLKNKSRVSAGSLARQLDEMKFTEAPPVEEMRELTKEEYEAAKHGNVALLNERMVSTGRNFLVSRTRKGGNILHILMQCKFNQKVIDKVEDFIGKSLQRLPLLIYQKDCNGNTPIHILSGNAHSGRLVEWSDKYFEKVREEAGDVGSRPWRLKNVKGDTPLHIAVRAKQYAAAIKLLEFDKEVASYVNNRIENPLHLLAYNSADIESENFLNHLLIGNADLPYMQDEEGLTPLLIAVRERRIFLIVKLRNQYPDCSKIADYKGKTLWHWFVQKRVGNLFSSYNCDALPCSERLIDNNNDIRRLILSKDNDGNTPLHIAIANGQFDFAQFFLKNCKADRLFHRGERNDYRSLLSIENKEGVSSYSLFGSAEHLPPQLEKFLFTNGNLLLGHRSLYGVPTTKIQEYANTIGVIAALLATVTFTAAFTVPGGLDSSNGTPLLLRKAAFQVFLVADVVAMCLSIMVLFCLLLVITTGDKGESIFLLDVSVFLLQTSLYATIVTFMTGLYVTTISIVPAIAIFTGVSCTLLIILMHKRLVMWTVEPFCRALIISGWMLRHLPSMWSRLINYNYN